MISGPDGAGPSTCGCGSCVTKYAGQRNIRRLCSGQDYLFSLKARGLKFGIDRMRVLVEALEPPGAALPGHPCRRHQWQGLGGGDARRHPAHGRLAHRPLHLAAPRQAGRAGAGEPPAAGRGGDHSLHKRTAAEPKNSCSEHFLETTDDSENLGRKLFYVFNQSNSIFEEQGYPVLSLQ